MEEEVGEIVVGDKGVETAVGIVVGEGDRHTAPEVFREARRDCDVFEFAEPQVAIELVGAGIVVARVAVDAEAFGLIAAEAGLVQIDAAVVGDEQIELAVVVEVEPAGGYGPFVRLDAGVG